MYGPEWMAARQVALQRDFNRCFICAELATDVHHRRVQGIGGRSRDSDRHAPAGLVSFCRGHHQQVHLQRTLAASLGYFIQPHEVPEKRHVWCPADHAWYELMTSGVRLAWPNLRSPEVQIL